MSPEQPAEHLARIKRQHPLWSIRHVAEGPGWTANRGKARVWAGTLGRLEQQLRDAGRGTP
jgi:hypothetical protein